MAVFLQWGWLDLSQFDLTPVATLDPLGLRAHGPSEAHRTQVGSLGIWGPRCPGNYGCLCPSALGPLGPLGHLVRLGTLGPSRSKDKSKWWRIQAKSSKSKQKQKQAKSALWCFNFLRLIDYACACLLLFAYDPALLGPMGPMGPMGPKETIGTMGRGAQGPNNLVHSRAIRIGCLMGPGCPWSPGAEGPGDLGDPGAQGTQVGTQASMGHYVPGPLGPLCWGVW